MTAPTGQLYGFHPEKDNAQLYTADDATSGW